MFRFSNVSNRALRTYQKRGFAYVNPISCTLPNIETKDLPRLCGILNKYGRVKVLWKPQNNYGFLKIWDSKFYFNYEETPEGIQIFEDLNKREISERGEKFLEHNSEIILDTLRDLEQNCQSVLEMRKRISNISLVPCGTAPWPKMAHAPVNVKMAVKKPHSEWVKGSGTDPRRRQLQYQYMVKAMKGTTGSHLIDKSNEQFPDIVENPHKSNHNNRFKAWVQHNNARTKYWK